MADMHTPLAALLSLGFGSERADEKIGWRGVYPKPTTDKHFRCEFCGEEHIDCTEIAHSEDCPVSEARAAVLACSSQDAETVKALRDELGQQRAVALQDALNEVEYLRDRISHPNGRRANRIDSMDEQRVEALNDAWDAINSARELALAGSAS